MSDRIITRAISPYVSWQGPEDACQALSDEDVERNKVTHGGIAANTHYYVRFNAKLVGHDPVHDYEGYIHDYEGTTECTKHVNITSSLPEISFKTSTHAYECGYRDGIKAAQLAAPEVKALAQSARELLAGVVSTYRSRNGRQMSFEADDGEKCLIVHSDLIAAIEHALAALEGR